MKTITKVLGLMVLIVTVTGALGACGKKTAPISPEGSTYPRQYPSR